MNTIIIANLFSLVGSSMMLGIGLLKKKRQIIIVQCLQFTLMGVANALLGGVTGVISNAASIARNLFCLKWEYTLPWKIVFIGLQVLLSAGANDLGLIGWFPVIATGIFTWFLDLKDEVKLKIVIIGTLVMWACYDFTLKNYVSFTFNLLSIVSTILGICLILRDRKAEK